jgi:DNA polymerase III sliding clamp (beta) subunit (PCNA family)
MRATIKPEDVARALKDSLVRGGLPRVLLSAENDSLSVTSTDLAAQLSISVTAEVSEPGEVLVDAATFSSLAALPSAVTLHTHDAQQVRAKCGKSSLRLFAQDARDFPRLDRGEWTAVPFSGAAAREAIQAVVYAADKDNVRSYLNCVHLHGGAVEASTGMIIARAPCNYGGPELLLPTAYIANVLRMLDEGTDAWVQIGEAGACKLKLASGADKGLVVPLLPGKYPDIGDYLDRFIADDFELHVARASLMMAVSALRPFASGKFPYAEFQCDESGARCVVDDNKIELHDAEVSGSCRAGFLINQLERGLSAMSAEELTITTGQQGTRIIRVHESNRVHLFSQATR